jgi:sugar phosphate isomerase/epimerase
MLYSRRDIGRLALAGLAAPRVLSRLVFADTRFGGVLIGAQSYSFRSIPDASAIVEAMRTMGLSAVELMNNHAEALAGAPTGRAAGAGRGAARGAGQPGGAGVVGAPAAGGEAPAAPSAQTPAGGQAPAGAPGANGRGGGRGRGRAALTPEQIAANQAAQEELRKWRMATTAGTWAPVRQKFTDAGIELKFLTYNIGTNTQDDEIEYAFTMAKGLGVNVISSSTQISTARRLVPFLEKHQITVAAHGHANVNNPDEISTEASFETVMGLSKYLAANLDIGHYVVAGGDPVAFLNTHHARVTNLHLKDRTRAGGNVPFGEGDTPIREVLLLLKQNKWDIPANIEFEYQGDPLVEVPKCIEYCRNVLV